jgi:diguanylate cyclase (GGDEF)-like protein
LDAAFDADQSPSLAAALPAAAAGLSFAATRHPWCLVWLVLAVAALAGRARLANAYASRPASDIEVDWEQRYRWAVACEAGVLGAGLALGVVLGQVALLAAPVAAAGLRLGMFIASPVPARAARPAAVALLAPVMAALLAFPTPVSLALAGFCALAAASLFVDPPAHPIAAAADALAPEQPAPVPQAVQDFQRLLGRDQITGLPNRPGFMRILTEESQRAVRAQSPLALLLITVDGLPDLLAAHKPAPESQVLAELADTIRGCLRRQSDQVACLSPGRFAVVLPFTDAVGATAAARNITAAFVPALDEEGAVADGVAATLSIGLAAYPGRGVLPDTRLLQQAEEAESAARKNGGNRISRYDPMANVLRPPSFAERQAGVRPGQPAGAVQQAPERSRVEQG